MYFVLFQSEVFTSIPPSCYSTLQASDVAYPNDTSVDSLAFILFHNVMQL